MDLLQIVKSQLGPNGFLNEQSTKWGSNVCFPFWNIPYWPIFLLSYFSYSDICKASVLKLQQGWGQFKANSLFSKFILGFNLDEIVFTVPLFVWESECVIRITWHIRFWGLMNWEQKYRHIKPVHHLITDSWIRSLKWNHQHSREDPLYSNLIWIHLPNGLECSWTITSCLPGYCTVPCSLYILTSMLHIN